jgi:hypothetical protein
VDSGPSLIRSLPAGSRHMKKQFSITFLAGAIIAFWGCTSLELRSILPGATMLNQSELEHLFYADKTAEFSSSIGRASVRYFQDGRQEIQWDNGHDRGTFRINNEEFCSTWTKLRNGAESCSKIYKIGEDEYEFIGSDGTSVAIMRIK